jgi:DNA helicase HerA-like ATPase
MDVTLGHVSSLAGAQMNVHAANGDTAGVRIGTLVKVENGASYAVGIVGAMHLDGGSQPVYIVDLLGEVVSGPNGRASFRRGVSHSPRLGAGVSLATREEMAAVYAPTSVANIRIGALTHDETQPAYIMLDELLQKHFAVVGTTGAGKSCAVTLVLSGILERQPNAHVVLLDPHNEYAAAFGDLADVVNVDSLHLPFWLFDLEEAVRVVVRGGTEQEQEAQAIILKDAIAQARRHYAGNGSDSSWITVDTPVPFRLHDLLRFINEAMGRLDKPDTARPYLRLRARLESLRDDKRYSFMFNETFANRDTLSQVVAHLLRIPVNGKPLTILDLSGVPSEIADVVVSLSCRVIFDFTLWSESERRPPILLVCEEAHRYVPDDERVGFAAAARALTRIAKEGRKYGLSLALVSQRPSELSVHALSQCGTIFALRMGNEADQRIVSRALPDAGHAMIRTLPSLPTQHAIVYGEGVALPMRIRFDDLPQNRRPHSESAEFSKAWQDDTADDAFRDEGIQRWRLQNRATRVPSSDGQTR